MTAKDEIPGTELAQAWKDWLASDEGKSCTSDSAKGIYLENRLHRAFDAAVKFCESRRVSR
jgi:hypothetical protein